MLRDNNLGEVDDSGSGVGERSVSVRVGDGGSDGWYDDW